MAKKKKKKEEDKRWELKLVDFRLEALNQQFKDQARIFNHMMDPERGAGIHCIAMLDTLRQLQFLYLDIAAHTHAKAAIEGK